MSFALRSKQQKEVLRIGPCITKYLDNGMHLKSALTGMGTRSCCQDQDEGDDESDEISIPARRRRRNVGCEYYVDHGLMSASGTCS